MKNNKLIKSITINIDVDHYNELMKLAELLKRKPAELTRLLFIEKLEAAYIELMKSIHPGNNIYKKL